MFGTGRRRLLDATLYVAKRYQDLNKQCLALVAGGCWMQRCT